MARSIEKQVYEVRKIPAGVKAIPTKLVLRIKLKSDGTVEKYKVRCVALGFLQRAGLHYATRMQRRAEQADDQPRAREHPHLFREGGARRIEQREAPASRRVHFLHPLHPLRDNRAFTRSRFCAAFGGDDVKAFLTLRRLLVVLPYQRGSLYF